MEQNELTKDQKMDSAIQKMLLATLFGDVMVMPPFPHEVADAAQTFDKDAIRDLWLWQHKDGDSFNCMLFTMCGKADPNNMVKMIMGWPRIVAVWKRWQYADGPEWLEEQMKIQGGKHGQVDAKAGEGVGGLAPRTT